jgi:hypothetical protein
MTVTRKEEIRKGATRPAGSLIKALVAPALRRQGFAECDVVTRWPAIVGPLLADRSLPLRLLPGKEGGTLQVMVSGAHALELQHLEPVVIERINGYFGFRAVARLSLKQAPLDIVKRRGPVVPPCEAAMRQAEETVSPELPDPLRQALTRLGGHVLEGHGKTGRRNARLHKT